jgi:dolichol-phosphate mannosyltransferase
LLSHPLAANFMSSGTVDLSGFNVESTSLERSINILENQLSPYVTELFVLLPAYNEGNNLLDLVRELDLALNAFRFRILIVDDGSTDGSTERVEAAKLKHVTVYRHEVNKGLGEALKTGFAKVLEQSSNENDVIIVLDSDCTHTPYLIDRMVRAIREGNDVVIASRYRYGARVVGLSLFRLFLSTAASWTFRLFLPITNVKDYTCGYRAYRAGMLRKAFQKFGEQFVSETGFSCMVDILVKLDRTGAIISEVPLILRYDFKQSTSKMKVLRTIRQSFSILFKHLLGGPQA